MVSGALSEAERSEDESNGWVGEEIQEVPREGRIKRITQLSLIPWVSISFRCAYARGVRAFLHLCSVSAAYPLCRTLRLAN